MVHRAISICLRVLRFASRDATKGSSGWRRVLGVVWWWPSGNSAAWWRSRRHHLLYLLYMVVVFYLYFKSPNSFGLLTRSEFNRHNQRYIATRTHTIRSSVSVRQTWYFTEDPTTPAASDLTQRATLPPASKPSHADQIYKTNHHQHRRAVVSYFLTLYHSFILFGRSQIECEAIIIIATRIVRGLLHIIMSRLMGLSRLMVWQYISTQVAKN